MEPFTRLHTLIIELALIFKAREAEEILSHSLIKLPFKSNCLTFKPLFLEITFEHRFLISSEVTPLSFKYLLIMPTLI